MRNSIEKIQLYDSWGLLSSITAAGIIGMAYTFNNKGHLLSRSDLFAGHKEDFTYDTMNRLTAWDVSKSNVSQVNNSINYNPTTGTISLGNKSLVLDYGVDEQRRKGVFKEGNVTFTRYYSGDYEEEISSSGKIKKIHYISGGDGLAGIYINDDGNSNFYSAYCDYQGSLLALTDINGVVKEKYAYDPWGNRRNPALWKDADTRTKFIIDRGYTLHEHLDALGLINMNGRVYDPLLGMFLSPDPYVQAPGNWLNYNRYGYCYGNPLLYTDPNGEIAWFIPVIIGAVIGAYTGGTIANDGQYNPAKWDYNSGKTWGYMFGGAAIGGISGVTGWAIAGSGMPMANTAAIAGSSLTNSLGTWAYTGGQTPVSISLGLASYDLKSNQWGYLGKKKNEWYENIGYGFGALANLSDMVSLVSGGGINADLIVEKKDAISHSALVNQSEKINISVGPYKDLGEGIDMDALKSKTGTFRELSRKMKDKIWPNHANDKAGWKLTINNISKRNLVNISNSLENQMKSKTLLWNLLGRSCVGYTSKALWSVGVPNLGGIHPYWLQFQMMVRQVGLYSSPYFYQIL